MIFVPMGDFIKEIGSVYKLTILAAKRTAQLSEGTPVMVPRDKAVKLSTLALREIKEQKIRFKESNKK